MKSSQPRVILLAIAANSSLSACASAPLTLSPGNPHYEQTGRYYLRGDATVLPASVSDDGYKTYIEWHPRQEMPAVFGLIDDKEESIVNGHLRGEYFVIDEVFAGLRFRLGDDEATALRGQLGAD